MHEVVSPLIVVFPVHTASKAFANEANDNFCSSTNTCPNGHRFQHHPHPLPRSQEGYPNAPRRWPVLRTATTLLPNHSLSTNCRQMAYYEPFYCRKLVQLYSASVEDALDVTCGYCFRRSAPLGKSQSKRRRNKFRQRPRLLSAY